MLKFMGLRHQVKPSIYVDEKEIKLFNIAKVVLDGGWVFDEETIDPALEIVGIKCIYTNYKEKLAAS